MGKQNFIVQVGFAFAISFSMLLVEHFLGSFGLWTNGTVMGLGVGLGIAWVFIALVGQWKNRPSWISWIVPGAVSDVQASQMVRSVLVCGRWSLCFRPDQPSRNDGGKKEIGFQDNGEIGIGRNQNEWTWVLKGRMLQIRRRSGQLHNVFRWNVDTGRFESTNQDSFALNEHQIHDQYIEPMRDT